MTDSGGEPDAPGTLNTGLSGEQGTSTVPSHRADGAERPHEHDGLEDEPVAPRATDTADAKADDANPLVDAVLEATRALVGIAARSLALLGEDVTLPQFRALVVLTTQGSQRLAELAQALRVDPSTATRMCDRLVRKELVHRQRTSDDRRGVRISLAPAGRELVDQVTRLRRTEIAEILSRLDPARCDAVLAAMEDLSRAAREPAPDDWALGWSTTTEPVADVD